MYGLILDANMNYWVVILVSGLNHISIRYNVLLYFEIFIKTKIFAPSCPDSNRDIHTFYQEKV